MKLDRHRPRRQPGRGRVGGQGAGEVRDEVLVTAVRRAGPEQVSPSPRQRPARPPARHKREVTGTTRAGRPADADRHPAAAAGRRRCRAAPPARRAAARRRCRTPPWPAPSGVSPDHAGRRRWRPARRVRPASTAGGGFAPANGVARCPGSPCTGLASRYSADRYVPRVDDAAAGQAGHAERLDHVIIQQELPAGRDPRAPRRTGTARAPPWRPPPAAAAPPQPACAGTSSPIAALPPHITRISLKRIHLQAHVRETRRPPAGTRGGLCGILATERRCQHQTPQRRPGQGSDPGGPRPDRLLPARHHHHPPRPVRQAPLRLRGRPAVPARPLHPVDPHRQRQDRHPAAHPGPVPGLRALVRQRPPAPGTGRRTGSPVPGRNGQGRRLGQDHPRHPGAAPHPPRPRPQPELPQTTQNAGRSARLTREQPSAEHP